MDSDFLEIIDEIIQFYQDRARVEELAGFWERIGEGVDGIVVRLSCWVVCMVSVCFCSIVILIVR